jgi:low affinity Fe/Cu permease
MRWPWAFAARDLNFFSTHRHFHEPAAFRCYLAPVCHSEWAVYTKRPFTGVAPGPRLRRAVYPPCRQAKNAPHSSNEEALMAQKMAQVFDKAAQWTAKQCGRPPIFALACSVVVLWAVLGPVFGYSDTWQLVINTGTTIVTFLMVFLIQNTQNRDTEALQIKLDELIRITDQARNRLLDLEDLTEEEMDLIKKDLIKLARKAKDQPDGLAIR